MLKEELPYTLPDEEGAPDIPVADLTDSAGNPIPTADRKSFTDTLIGVEVSLPRGDGTKGLCKVLRQAVDEKGRTIGEANDNLEFNTTVYKCQCWDGVERHYAANVIAEEIYNQADDSGQYSADLKRIRGHRRDPDAVTKEQASSKQGSKHRYTTKGWRLLCEWWDGSRKWVALSDLKENYPVCLAQYAVAQGIDDEPAFRWWVSYTLRKSDVIVGAVKARMKHKSIKYGVQVPRSLKHAQELDIQNGNNLWQKAYEKEMANVGIAFQILVVLESVILDVLHEPENTLLDSGFIQRRVQASCKQCHRGVHGTE